jgi:hypothetical protein
LRHFFAEDVAGVRCGLDRVLEHDPALLYVGHGGPTVSTTDVRRRIDSIAPRGRDLGGRSRHMRPL